MSRSGLPHDVIEYPCSDGQPMAGTQFHGGSTISTVIEYPEETL